MALKTKIVATADSRVVVVGVGPPEPVRPLHMTKVTHYDQVDLNLAREVKEEREAECRSYRKRSIHRWTVFLCPYLTGRYSFLQLEGDFS